MVEEIIWDTKKLREIDKKVKMISLTFDPIFKGLFERNLEILKRFLIRLLAKLNL